MGPTIATVLCADWAGSARGREVFSAVVGERSVRRIPVPAGGWDVEAAVKVARDCSTTGGVLLGFDAPLGVPRSFWEAARAALDSRPGHFAEWLHRLDSRFFDTVPRPEDWSIRRPFFAVPHRAEGGLTAFVRAAARQRVDLWRAVDRRVGGKPPFVVAGIPGSVGSAARDLWRSLPPHRERGEVGVWPFDGSIEALLTNNKVAVAEIYPALAYARALAPQAVPRGRKTDREWRERVFSLLAAANWIRQFEVSLPGAGSVSSGDAFDACLNAAAILRCALEGSPLAASDVDPVAEGGILCEDSAMAPITHPKATEADLLNAPKDGRKYELVDGEVVMSPAGSRHGAVCARLITRLGPFIEQRRLGYLFDSSTGFRMPNGNVRLPDVAFVARGRFEGGKVPEGFSPVAPDLAVEVLSPDDRPRHVLDKVGEYLDAGVPLVWVVDPKTRTATVYRSLTNVRMVVEDGDLDGEDILPGFRCPLADIVAE